MEMLHQDIRPDNIMIDKTGTVKIIDFGSTKVKGVIEAVARSTDDDILGTVQYTAPEYFVGESGTLALRHLLARRHHLSDADRSRLPYGAEVAKIRTKIAAAKAALRHRRSTTAERDSGLIDEVLQEAMHPDRVQALRRSCPSSSIELRQSGQRRYLDPPVPLIERNPLLFWKCLSVVLFRDCLMLLYSKYG